MTVLAERVEALIAKTIDECERGWRPRLETALSRVAELEGQLVAEQRKHERFLAMMNSTARADGAAISRQRQTIADQWILIDELRARLPRKGSGQSKETPDAA